MKLDKGMLKDPKFQVGAVAAVGLGAFALYRRSKSGSSSSTGSGTAGTVTTGYTGTAGVDTTGTDVASWLGDYSSSLQSQLDAYNKQLGEQVNALKNLPVGGEAQSPGYTTVNVQAGQHLSSLVGGGSDQAAAARLRTDTGGVLQWPSITTAGPQGYGPGNDLVFTGPGTVRVLTG
jgi:hypothetical protein